MSKKRGRGAGGRSIVRPSTILCADWSGDPRRRAVYVADVASLVVRRASAKGSWTVASALELAAESVRPTLLGFDSPLGVPESYRRLIRKCADWSGRAKRSST